MNSINVLRYKIDHTPIMIKSLDHVLQFDQRTRKHDFVKIGDGNIETYQFHEGLSLQITKVKLDSTISIERIGTNDADLLVLDFHIRGSGNLDSINSSGRFNYGAYFATSDIQTKGVFKPRTYLEQLHIVINKNWLLSFFPETIWDVFRIEKLSASFFMFERISSKITKAIHELLSESNCNDFKKPFLEAKTLEILSLFFHQLKNKKGQRYSYNILQTDIEKVLDLETYIQENLNKDLSGVVLSNIIGFSESKLQKLFKVIYGKSIHKKVTEIKMLSALKMLELKRHTISEIGYQVGYHNMSHFAKAFKRINGFLPSTLSKELYY